MVYRHCSPRLAVVPDAMLLCHGVASAVLLLTREPVMCGYLCVCACVLGCSLQGKQAEQLSGLYRQALDAGLEALQQEVAAAAAGAGDGSWGPLLDVLEPIKVSHLAAL